MYFDCRLGIPFGTHQLRELEEYSHRVKSLNLLIDMKEHVDLLNKTMGHYSILIKVDTGYHRAGLDAAKPDAIVALAKYVRTAVYAIFLASTVTRVIPTTRSRRKTSVVWLERSAMRWSV